ncbi:hypothetical protein D3C87_1917140 [compost metagenome]
MPRLFISPSALSDIAFRLVSILSSCCVTVFRSISPTMPMRPSVANRFGCAATKPTTSTPAACAVIDTKARAQTARPRMERVRMRFM